jgi:hypothetical protein
MTGPVRVCAKGQRVLVSSPCLEARCNHLSSTAVPDQVLLEGNVRVLFHMEGRPACIEAQRVVVGLRDGSYEVNPVPEAGSPVTPVGFFPVMPPAPAMPFKKVMFGMPFPPLPPGMGFTPASFPCPCDPVGN